MMTVMNQQDPQWLIAVGAVVLTCLALIVAWRISKRRAEARREALRHQALMLGCAFEPQPMRLDRSESAITDLHFTELLGSMRLFQKRRRPEISNRLSRAGEGGGTDWVFDFSYVTGSGKNRRTVRQTVAAHFEETLECPRFALQPEGLFSRIFDGADIDFDQDPEFSKKYLLKGDDASKLRQVFTPYVRSELMQDPHWSIEAGGHAIVGWRSGHLVRPEDLSTFLAVFRRVLEALRNELE